MKQRGEKQYGGSHAGIEKIITGIPGLDQILQGGIPRFSTLLIAGKPGTGKTILTQNILFNNAKDHKVLYITTLSEPQIKVLRYQQQFAFFDKSMFMDSVIFRDLGSTIRQKGVVEALSAIDALVREHQPALLAIDSFKAIGDILATPNDFRNFIADLTIRLSVWECTALLVGEYAEDRLENQPEAAIVDGIMYLYGTEERKRQKRYLRILKMRGTDYIAGEHDLHISGSGVEVYPRWGSDLTEQHYGQPRDHKEATGIEGLDQMLHGGLPAGSTTMVSGSTGTGKTLLSLKWLIQGCHAKEGVLMLSFDENPLQLAKNAASFGWPLQQHMETGLFHVIHVSPIEVDFFELVNTIKALVAKEKVARIVVDSISSFEIGMQDKIKYTDFLWGLVSYFKRMGVSLMLIDENKYLFSPPQMTKHGTSYLADNIIYLFYAQAGNELRRFIGVLKMRGSTHTKTINELIIEETGPKVVSTSAPLTAGFNLQMPKKIPCLEKE
jgi:circadian clock protein KaiC